jgi:hypothetical protein
MQNNPTCQVCSNGELRKKKKYRMSGPVVTTGYILLVPSILGILFGILLLFSSGKAADSSFTGIDDSFKASLVEANVPEATIQKAFSTEGLTQVDREALTPEQRTAITDAELSRNAGKVGAGAGTAIAGGLGIVLIIIFFVGGLLGWLLIMTKKVLQCVSCNAVVAAS